MGKEIRRDVIKELIKWKERDTGRVLQLDGARRIGKTFMLHKFARSQFRKYLFIDCIGNSGEKFIECLKKAEEFVPGKAYLLEQSTREALRLYDKEFVDSKETIVVIDEIQESSYVYNHIRDFARQFNCYFIVAGSYLGRLKEKEFFLPAGDIDRMTIYPLTFPEFLDVFQLREIYNQISLSGNLEEDYEMIRKYYDIYEQIGGYPEVVLAFLENRSIETCKQIRADIVRTFTDESEKYLVEAAEHGSIYKVLDSFTGFMIHEVRGIGETEESIFEVGIERKMVVKVREWLRINNIIDYCCGVADADFKRPLINSQYFYRDIGVAEYFLERAGISEKERKDILAKTYVHNVLRRNSELVERPYFSVFPETGEKLDFVVRRKTDYDILAINIKDGQIQIRDFKLPVWLADRLKFSELR